jgi:hypothetical protein
MARSWTGELRATKSMLTPTPFPMADLPLEEMMLADKEWVPIALSGRKIFIEAWYGPYQKTLLKPVIVNEVADFE